MPPHSAPSEPDWEIVGGSGGSDSVVAPPAADPSKFPPANGPGLLRPGGSRGTGDGASECGGKVELHPELKTLSSTSNFEHREAMAHGPLLQNNSLAATADPIGHLETCPRSKPLARSPVWWHGGHLRGRSGPRARRSPSDAPAAPTARANHEWLECAPLGAGARAYSRRPKSAKLDNLRHYTARW